MTKLSIAKNCLIIAAAVTQFHCDQQGDSQAAIATDADVAADALSATVASPISVNSRSDLCLDIANNASSNGSPVGIYTCNGSDAQKWILRGGMLIAPGNRCLNVTDGNTGNNVKLQIWTCSSTDKNNLFTVNNNTIKWTVNGKCLDVTGGNMANGTLVQLYDCFDRSPNQMWNTDNSPSKPTTNLNTSPAAPAPAASVNSGSKTDMLPGFVADAKQIPFSSMNIQTMAQGQVNNEQQAYINDGSTVDWSSGTLVLTARPKGNNYSWVSGKVEAPPLGTSRGYVEASILSPASMGTWPAFWLMPRFNDPIWPLGGEVDIFEIINGVQGNYSSTHWGTQPGNGANNTTVWRAIPDAAGNYHRYGVAWDSTHLAFYIDGRKVPGSVYYYAAGSPFARMFPKYTPIMNLAIGGDWPKGQGNFGSVPDSLGRQTLSVKYVAQSVNTPADF
jgi:beta-glucanase (GH16 family)